MTDTEVVEEVKIASGFQSAVRFGVMTPAEVLNVLDRMECEGNYIRPSFRRWLRGRK